MNGTNQPGTGIGLSLLKLLVDAHHGYVRLNSTDGVGTEFKVILPIEQDADAFAKAEGFMDGPDSHMDEPHPLENLPASNSAPSCWWWKTMPTCEISSAKVFQTNSGHWRQKTVVLPCCFWIRTKWISSYPI